ncbi:hypothetical protein OAO42_00935 [Candidatus Izimaplasma bacterium]|nr:hypothetical protein [Candidatus Izimaplasma bacterium]
MSVIMGLFDYFRLVSHRKFYNEKQIRKYQEKQLKKLYKFAVKNSEFYSDLYKNNKFLTLDDFYSLPTINKSIMMEHFSTLNTCGLNKEDVMIYAVEKEVNKDFYGYYKDEYVVGLSSGTSGNKGIYITTKYMTKRLPFVFLARGGFPLRSLPYRILFMLRVFSQGFEDINSKLVSLSYLSTMENIDMVIDKINDQNINILMAPPSLVRELLPFANDITSDIKRIMTYAEVLETEDKERFEKDFNTKVIEIYQASEGQMASACKHGHLHINEDLVFIELYDDQGNLITKENVVGHKMIITNLINYAQPLLRYEMNDMVILDTKCSCGSNFRRIKKVLGRHDDLLYFTDSKQLSKYIFPDLFVRWIIVCSENIREFQVIQNKINEATIYLDLLSEDKEDIMQMVKEKLYVELALFDIKNPVINIEFKGITLPKNKNKYKRFVSNVIGNTNLD